MAEDIPPEALRSQDSSKFIPPLYGALLKNEQDVQLFERLAFMSRWVGGRRHDPVPPRRWPAYCY
jgi:hypothetical protein